MKQLDSRFVSENLETNRTVSLLFKRKEKEIFSLLPNPSDQRNPLLLLSGLLIMYANQRGCIHMYIKLIQSKYSNSLIFSSPWKKKPAHPNPILVKKMYHIDPSDTYTLPWIDLQINIHTKYDDRCAMGSTVPSKFPPDWSSVPETMSPVAWIDRRRTENGINSTCCNCVYDVHIYYIV